MLTGLSEWDKLILSIIAANGGQIQTDLLLKWSYCDYELGFSKKDRGTLVGEIQELERRDHLVLPDGWENEPVTETVISLPDE